MKKAIYLDNFRGFKNTYIPIDDVNFLVGENSTGKSSVLTILSILFSQHFWMALDFNTKETLLGSFEDLVSAESKDKSSFTIAHSFFVKAKETPSTRSKNKTSTKKHSEIANGIALTFIEDDGQIVPEKVTFIDSNKIVHATIGKEELKYLTVNVESIQGFQALEILKELVKHHNSIKSEELTTVKLPKGANKVRGSIPFCVIKMILEETIQKKDISKKTTFEFDNTAPASFWLGPIREEPKRLYDTVKPAYASNGSHIPYVLNDLLNEQKNKKTKDDLLSVLRKFGTESGLFADIAVERYGSGRNAPFSLKVALRKTQFKISSVGYGVSQVLPVIIEAFIRRTKTIFLMQQPEVHLHPRAQAALGSFFFQMSKSEGKYFLIETHSDFLIDRFRLEMKNNPSHGIHAQILYFEHTKNGNVCHPIKIEEGGRFASNQPDSFQNFFIHEQLEMISI